MWLHALMCAAQRGVTCRAMVDEVWALRTDALATVAADAAGRRAPGDCPAYQQLLKVMLTSRIDLRNHRKITPIDGRINHCGSQNCADEGFRIKARYAPGWDIRCACRVRWSAQMQQAFASDLGAV